MLVLTRRIGETIVINDEINLTLLGIRGNQARFGIDAPKNIRVNRKEIQDRICPKEISLRQAEKPEAAFH